MDQEERVKRSSRAGLSDTHIDELTSSDLGELKGALVARPKTSDTRLSRYENVSIPIPTFASAALGSVQLHSGAEQLTTDGDCCSDDSLVDWHA